MNERSGVLFVRRVRWWAEGRAKGPRNAAVKLSEDQLARAYRGIDGQSWPPEVPLPFPRNAGLASIEHWAQIAKVAIEHTNETVYDAIVLMVQPHAPTLPRGVEFLGFDVGFYDDEDNVFSSIYHEAIHSQHMELRRYVDGLNESLLFPSLAQADDYRHTRDGMRGNGKDVEDEDCRPIAIFGWRRQA